ncbi:two pore domain potassium channel family protein [Candidatus Micrarchaeota archaeon]|nr:two pore domain potassium channel family protein [Candidatus Micrarchaeota archaeon]
MENLRRNVLLSLFLIVLMYIIGAIVYHNLEGWSFLDAVYFQTMTFTTVGYGDVVPVTDAGKVFTIVIAWLGISIGFFLLYNISAYRERVVDERLIHGFQDFGKKTGFFEKEKIHPRIPPPTIKKKAEKKKLGYMGIPPAMKVGKTKSKYK